MADDLFLIDTNVLIRWVQHGSTDFDQVNAAIQQIVASGSIPCYTSQNLGEFWNVLTRPLDRNGYGLTPEAADRRARDVEAALLLLADSIAVHAVWRRLLVNYQISGVKVHDARLIAAMTVHGAKRILTFNHKDFIRFRDIEAVHPLELVQNR